MSGEKKSLRDITSVAHAVRPEHALLYDFYTRKEKTREARSKELKGSVWKVRNLNLRSKNK